MDYPCCFYGSIPAWAGEPSFAASAKRICKVYPRVGGEPTECLRYDGVGGLSPRVGSKCLLVGSIPAWAGEPGPGRWIHAFRSTGSIPAWAGGRRESRSIPAWAGEPKSSNQCWAVQKGSIPAWAGEPWNRPVDCGRVGEAVKVYPRVGGGTLLNPRPFGQWVYPRVGGGTVFGARIPVALVGLSPRGPQPWAQHTLGVYPRVGGGTLPQSSNSCQRVYPRVGGGTGCRAAGRACLEVYPRVGGGTR